jgi:hypothetical protein
MMQVLGRRAVAEAADGEVVRFGVSEDEAAY